MRGPFEFGERYRRCKECGILRPAAKLDGDRCSDAELCLRLKQWLADVEVELK